MSEPVFAEHPSPEHLDMDSSYIIAALAIFTIGSTLALAIFHFGFHLKDPKNLEAAKRVAADNESAATRVASEGAHGRTLRQRLDEAPGVNARLGRDVGVGPVDAVFGTKWSDVRRSVTGMP